MRLNLFKRKQPDAVGVFGNTVTATRAISIHIEEFVLEDGIQKAKIKAVTPNGQSVRFTLGKADSGIIQYTMNLSSEFSPSSVEDGR